MKIAEDILFDTLSYYNCDAILSDRVRYAVIKAISDAQIEAWNAAIDAAFNKVYPLDSNNMIDKVHSSDIKKSILKLKK